MVNGTGDPECLGWTGRVCAAAIAQGHDITYYNLGVRRETSADIAARWASETACRLPADCNPAMVFCFGVNDTTIESSKGIEGNRLRLSPSDSLRHARQMLTAAGQRCPVLMVGPPPIADPDHSMRIAALSYQLAHLCHTLAIPFLDIFTPLQQSQVWMQEVEQYDGAHPAAAGYGVFAQWVNDWPAWQKLLSGDRLQPSP